MTMYGDIRKEQAPPPASRPTGRAILSASWMMLREDRQLLWLPILSAVASVIAAVALFVSGFLVGNAIGHTDSAAVIVGGALGGFAATAVGIYFQAALVIGANQRAEGIQPTLGGVLAAALKRGGPILGWAVLTTTVGMAIRAFEERLGLLGAVLGFLGELAWGIVSFLVLPVLVVEGLGPIEAVRRSGQLLRQTWGTSLRTTLRFGLVQVLAMLAPIVGVVIGIMLVVPGTEPQRSLGIVVLAVSIVALVVLGTVFSAISTYARALIYRYAVGADVPGLAPEVFAGAFMAKKRRGR